MSRNRVDLVDDFQYELYTESPTAAINMLVYKACMQGNLQPVLNSFDSSWVKDNIDRGQRFFDEQKFTSLKNTYLHAACCSGNTELVMLLMEYQAGVHVRNKKLQTPLHLAVEKGHHEIVVKLLEAKAEVNAASVNGKTPLHLAADRGHFEVVETLLGNQAEVNAASSFNVRPLHLAAERGHLRVVKRLLEAQADIDAAGNAGLTALHSATLRACRLMDNSVMVALLEKGAKLLRDQSGSSPLDIACEARHWKVIDLLLKNRNLTGFEGHARTLFRALKRNATYIALKLLGRCGNDSAKFQFLVSALVYAQTEKEDMDSMVCNIKALFRANSGVFPGGMASLLQEAEELEKADIVDLIRDHEARVSRSSSSHSEDDILDQMVAC